MPDVHQPPASWGFSEIDAHGAAVRLDQIGAQYMGGAAIGQAGRGNGGGEVTMAHKHADHELLKIGLELGDEIQAAWRELPDTIRELRYTHGYSLAMAIRELVKATG